MFGGKVRNGGITKLHTFTMNIRTVGGLAKVGRFTMNIREFGGVEEGGARFYRTN